MLPSKYSPSINQQLQALAFMLFRSSTSQSGLPILFLLDVCCSSPYPVPSAFHPSDLTIVRRHHRGQSTHCLPPNRASWLLSLLVYRSSTPLLTLAQSNVPTSGPGPRGTTPILTPAHPLPAHFVSASASSTSPHPCRTLRGNTRYPGSLRGCLLRLRRVHVWVGVYMSG